MNHDFDNDIDGVAKRLMTPPPPRGYDDTDRNILAGLRHEACEVCVVCDEHVCSVPISPFDFDWAHKTVEGDPACEEHAA